MYVKIRWYVNKITRSNVRSTNTRLWETANEGVVRYHCSSRPPRFLGGPMSSVCVRVFIWISLLKSTGWPLQTAAIGAVGRSEPTSQRPAVHGIHWHIQKVTSSCSAVCETRTAYTLTLTLTPRKVPTKSQPAASVFLSYLKSSERGWNNNDLTGRWRRPCQQIWRLNGTISRSKSSAEWQTRVDDINNHKVIIIICLFPNDGVSVVSSPLAPPRLWLFHVVFASPERLLLPTPITTRAGSRRGAPCSRRCFCVCVWRCQTLCNFYLDSSFLCATKQTPRHL